MNSRQEDTTISSESGGTDPLNLEELTLLFDRVEESPDRVIYVLSRYPYYGSAVYHGQGYGWETKSSGFFDINDARYWVLKMDE